MEYCRRFIKGYVIMMQDDQGTVQVNQHEVANAYDLNSGHVSVILRELVNKGTLRKMSPHGYRKPAVYQVIA